MWERNCGYEAADHQRPVEEALTFVPPVKLKNRQMSTQAQMEEIRRLSGEHKPAPPAVPEPERPPSKRVTIAMLLTGLVAVTLLHSVLMKRVAPRMRARVEREATIAARAAAKVATAFGGEGDALRAAMSTWQKEHPRVQAVRVVNVENHSFEASSFPEDLAQGKMPRQIQRPEEPLYDLGQELRSIEGDGPKGRKREHELAVSRTDSAVVAAAPVENEGEVVGFAQVKLRLDQAVEPPSFWFAMAFALAPFVVVLALSFVIRRDLLLALIACALLLIMLFAYRQWALRALEGGAAAAEVRLTE